MSKPTPAPVVFSTVAFDAFDGEEEYTMWGIVADDGTDGFIIGEWSSVLAVHAALTRLVESGQADESVDELDDRLGHRWLSVSEAATRFGVPVSTVRRAAMDDKIPMVKKDGNEWRFPRRKFLWWLSVVYTPRAQPTPRSRSGQRRLK